MHNNNVHTPYSYGPVTCSSIDDYTRDKPYYKNATTRPQSQHNQHSNSFDLNHQNEKIKPSAKYETTETFSTKKSLLSNKQLLCNPSQRDHATGTHSHTFFHSKPRKDYSRKHDHSSRQKIENFSQQKNYLNYLENRNLTATNHVDQTYCSSHIEKNVQNSTKKDGQGGFHVSHGHARTGNVHKIDNERKERREDNKETSITRGKDIENTTILRLTSELENNTIGNIKKDTNTSTEFEIKDSARIKVESVVEDKTELSAFEVHESKSQAFPKKKLSLDQYKARNRNIMLKKSNENTSHTAGDDSEERLKNSSPVSRILGESVESFLKTSVCGSVSRTSTNSNDEVTLTTTEANTGEREPLEEKEEQKNLEWKNDFTLNREILNSVVERQEMAMSLGDFYGKTKALNESSSPLVKSIERDPVILTISSDEEDNSESGKENRKGKKKHLSDTVQVGGGAEEKKVSWSGKSYDDDDLFADKELTNDHVKLRCKKLWIGSYHVRPMNGVILVSRGCFILNVPKVAFGSKKDFVRESVKLTLERKGIVKVSVHLDGEDPMIFLYPGRKMVKDYIHKKLRMISGGPYLDSHSKDECEKRIVIFAEPLNPEMKHSIQEFWTNVERTPGRPVLFTELTDEDAADVLLKIKPNEDQEQYTSKPKGTKTLFVYPPLPHIGGITITTDDYCRLEEEQFVNDVIIDFYINWILTTQVREEDRKRTHAFTTFFYKRLTSKSLPSVEGAMSPAQQRHARVQSWTKNLNIFEKDFILVPINERSHWFLAIICFPNLNGPAKMSDRTPLQLKKVEVEKSPKKTESSVENFLLDDPEGSERDEAEGDDEDLEEAEVDLPAKKQKTEDLSAQETSTTMHVVQRDDKDKEEEPIIQPCILIFDSLTGSASSKKRIVATLREYLAEEYRAKMKGTKEISKETMKGACPKVPQQSNFTDCGLYTLQFAQSFFEQPLKDFRFPIGTLSNWFNQDVVARKREYIAGLIREILNKQKPNHGISLPKLHSSYSENRMKQPDRKSESSSDSQLLDEKGKEESLLEIKSEAKYVEKDSKALQSDNLQEANYKSLSTMKRNESPVLTVSKIESKMLEKSGQEKSSGENRRVHFEPHDISLPQAKKLKVTICDKSSKSNSRPKTPLPSYKKIPSPSSISDDDSGHHSDIEYSNDLNKSLGRMSSTCSGSFPSTSSERNHSFLNSKESSRGNFSVSSNSAFSRPTKGSEYISNNCDYRSNSPTFPSTLKYYKARNSSKSTFRSHFQHRYRDKYFKYDSRSDRK